MVFPNRRLACLEKTLTPSLYGRESRYEHGGVNVTVKEPGFTRMRLRSILVRPLRKGAPRGVAPSPAGDTINRKGAAFSTYILPDVRIYDILLKSAAHFS